MSMTSDLFSDQTVKSGRLSFLQRLGFSVRSKASHGPFPLCSSRARRVGGRGMGPRAGPVCRSDGGQVPAVERPVREDLHVRGRGGGGAHKLQAFRDNHRDSQRAAARLQPRAQQVLRHVPHRGACASTHLRSARPSRPALPRARDARVWARVCSTWGADGPPTRGPCTALGWRGLTGRSGPHVLRTCPRGAAASSGVRTPSVLLSGSWHLPRSVALAAHERPAPSVAEERALAGLASG
jgi:hypothetical protein